MSELLTLPEVAGRLGVGKSWLWQQTARGNLRTVRLPGGRLVRVREQDLQDFIAAHVEGRALDIEQSQSGRGRRPTIKERDSEAIAGGARIAI